MNEFAIIKNDVGGISDNCVWELQKVVKSKESVLNFKNICPTGNSFLELNTDIISEYL
jgi:hypothetical protein